MRPQAYGPSSPSSANAKSPIKSKEIQQKVKQAGLWAPHLPEEYGGCELSFLEHAYMNEVLAYATGAASLVRRARAARRNPLKGHPATA